MYILKGSPIDDGRIVGGEDANILNLPYQISLMRFGGHSCGGSILNENTILTAAHCVDGAYPEYLTVRAGSNSSSSGGQIVQVVSFVMHHHFSMYHFDYDVAILKVSPSLVYGPGVGPVKLVSEENFNILPGTSAVVSGWGRLNVSLICLYIKSP